MNRFIRHRHSIKGFTLLELSVVLVIMALVSAMAVSSGVAVLASARQSATTKKMAAIDNALMSFRTSQDRLPCPADLTAVPNVTSSSFPNYGVEAANPGTCTGGTPAANFSGTGAVEGGIPTVSLGLPNDFMYDGWGNRIRYAVNASATATGYFSSTPLACGAAGAITINDALGNPRSTGALYVLLSHGSNGYGAYTQNGVMSTTRSDNANERTNCHYSGSACANAASYGTFTPTYVQQASSQSPTDALNVFDDLVTSKERWEMATDWDSTTYQASANPVIYFGDFFNGRIRKIANGLITTVAGNGYYDNPGPPYGDGGLATSAWIGGGLVRGLAVDGSGNIYLTSNFAIRKVSQCTGIITLFAGSDSAYCGYGGTYICGDGGLATSAKLRTPMGVAADSSGNIYIADTYDYAIRKVTASTGIINTIAGMLNPNFSLCSYEYPCPSTLGVATSTILAMVNSIAVDSSGNIYFLEYNANYNGVLTMHAGGNTLSWFPGTYNSTVAAYGVGITVDSSGNLYTTDTTHYKVLKIAANTGTVTTIAGNGTQGFSGDTGPATSAEINPLTFGPGDNWPSNVAVDNAGNIYIADGGNNRIRMVSASTGIITTIAGTGTAGFSGDGGPAISAELNNPYGIVVTGR